MTTHLHVQVGSLLCVYPVDETKSPIGTFEASEEDQARWVRVTADFMSMQRELAQKVEQQGLLPLLEGQALQLLDEYVAELCPRNGVRTARAEEPA